MYKMEKNEKKPNKKRKVDSYTFIIAVFIVFMAIITLLSMVIFKLRIWNSVNVKNEISNDVVYDRYYALISSDDKSEFWESVLKGAKEYGEESGAFVESFASNLDSNYSMSQRIEMAIASGVNGIILEGDTNEDLTSFINEARNQGIPVVSAREDIVDADNISFVGCSEYDMGLIYGTQIVRLASKIRADQRELELPLANEMSVKILMSSTASEGGQNLLLSSIREEIARNYTLSHVLKLDICTIDDSGSFTAEESIRDLFLDKKEAPDIIVCLNELQTNCVYQVVVDYNRVGETNIIGFYDSENILNEIKKEIIYSSVSLDTEQMGKYCVEALDEYSETGIASDYYAVDNYVVNADNVDEYIGGAE